VWLKGSVDARVVDLRRGLPSCWVTGGQTGCVETCDFG
jgi:hypothetical protein